MTWTQIVRKLQVGTVVGCSSDSASIPEQIAKSIGYRDEASCELLISSRLDLRNSTEAEEVLKCNIIINSDFGKIRIVSVSIKESGAAILTLCHARNRSIILDCVQVTRES